MARRFNLHADVEARIWGAILIGCAGAAAGEIYNALGPRGVFAPVPVVNEVAPPVVKPVQGPAAKPEAEAKASPATPRVIDLAEARSLSGRKAAVFVDARSALRFASGHIPRAVNIPSADFPAAFAMVKASLPADGAVVVYCESADCDESDIVLEELVKRGYTRLMHFKAGWQAWEDSGLPQERGASAR